MLARGRRRFSGPRYRACSSSARSAAGWTGRRIMKSIPARRSELRSVRESWSQIAMRCCEAPSAWNGKASSRWGVAMMSSQGAS